MNQWLRKRGQNVSGSYLKRTSLNGTFDVDIVAICGAEISYAMPEMGRRVAEWSANFPLKDRPAAIIQLRNALAHGQTSVVTMNFDALLASHYDAFPVVDSRPPAGAQYLLLLLPKKYREGLLGDLEEEYRTVVFPRYGPLWAKVYYWVQVLSSFLPILWRLLEQIAVRR
jgi:hypothetical protein